MKVGYALLKLNGYADTNKKMKGEKIEFFQNQEEIIKKTVIR